MGLLRSVAAVVLILAALSACGGEKVPPATVSCMGIVGRRHPVAGRDFCLVQASKARSL